MCVPGKRDVMGSWSHGVAGLTLDGSEYSGAGGARPHPNPAPRLNAPGAGAQWLIMS
jgi:hypothetical protein